MLAEVGDKLHYVYDFGDDWQHIIKLEAVLSRDDRAPGAVCARGRRSGPAEDCGGVYAYELIAAATDLDDPDHPEAAAAFDRCYGNEVDPKVFSTTPFDMDEINSALASLGFARPRPVRG